jgi:hypothetical protein
LIANLIWGRIQQAAIRFSVLGRVLDYYESFVDAKRAAEFLSITPRYLLGLARTGHIPAYPLGSGPRKVWRFRLSELSRAFDLSLEHNHSQQPSTAKRR